MCFALFLRSYSRPTAIGSESSSKASSTLPESIMGADKLPESRIFFIRRATRLPLNSFSAASLINFVGSSMSWHRFSSSESSLRAADSGIAIRGPRTSDATNRLRRNTLPTLVLFNSSTRPMTFPAFRRHSRITHRVGSSISAAFASTSSKMARATSSSSRARGPAMATKTRGVSRIICRLMLRTRSSTGAESKSANSPALSASHCSHSFHSSSCISAAKASPLAAPTIQAVGSAMDSASSSNCSSKDSAKLSSISARGPAMVPRRRGARRPPPSAFNAFILSTTFFFSFTFLGASGTADASEAPPVAPP
mmetsp:Transcript_54189/g.155729  ORF Transcript_54189/g.155729 Transcript_54189/m.155729 type:complete len:310 (+) Transcript_54189:402-1331(+)